MPRKSLARPIPEGLVRRGFRFRAYPTPEQEERLAAIRVGLKRCWNVLCSRSRDTKKANRAYALRNGLVAPPPERPIYEGLSPEDSHEAKREYERNLKAWSTELYRAIKGLPECKYYNIKDWIEHFKVKHDYQIFGHLLEWYTEDGEAFARLPPAQMLQALCKDYEFALAATKRGQRAPQFKKTLDEVSVRISSGRTNEEGRSIFQQGAFGPRPNCPNGAQWLNAKVYLPGVGWIPCRIGPKQRSLLQVPERRLEGISLVKEADGWYAALRQDVPPKEAPATIPGTACGIDVGLIDLAAIVGNSAPDGETDVVVKNPRGREYIERIAGRQSQNLPVSKLQCRAARNTRQIVRERVLKHIDAKGYEVICIEDLNSRIGQMGAPHVSVMRTVRTFLIQRYGEARVREVCPRYTSQDCSQCGERSAESWSCEHGRIGECPHCGHSEHRDLNAARNILRRGLESQDS